MDELPFREFPTIHTVTFAGRKIFAVRYSETCWHLERFQPANIGDILIDCYGRENVVTSVLVVMDIPKLTLHRERLSIQDLIRAIEGGEYRLESILSEMMSGSCSVALAWREDRKLLWECSWIVGGSRYTGHNWNPREAVLRSVKKCMEALTARAERDARRGANGA